MKISNVQAQQNATLENVEVVSKEEPRQFEKFGKTVRVCNAKIKDDSGELQLTLWNDEIDQVEQGDTISIIDGWVKDWQGNLQVSAGRNGKIVKGDASASPAEETTDEAATEETTEEEEAPAEEESTEESEKETESETEAEEESKEE